MTPAASGFLNRPRPPGVSRGPSGQTCSIDLGMAASSCKDKPTTVYAKNVKLEHESTYWATYWATSWAKQPSKAWRGRDDPSMIRLRRSQAATSNLFVGREFVVALGAHPWESNDILPKIRALSLVCPRTRQFCFSSGPAQVKRILVS